MNPPLLSPSSASIRSGKPAIPLLSLAPPALALGDELAVGEPGDDNNAGEIWNVITRAADLVKDGERLENLAWRHWGQPKRTSTQESTRRLSMSSQATTASSLSINTPIDSEKPPFLHRSKSSEKLKFGGALKLLLEKDENKFKDWVEDAKKHFVPPTINSPTELSSLPTISVPDTPIANFEIRLVEPTPVPSRVGSLGGSMNISSGLLSSNTNSQSTSSNSQPPPSLKEDIIAEEKAIDTEEKSKDNKNVRMASVTPIGTPSRRNSATNLNSNNSTLSKKKNSKFFVQSSPTKGSGSDSSHLSHTSPIIPKSNQIVPSPVTPAPTALSPNNKHGRRRSSGDSSVGNKIKPLDLNLGHLPNGGHPHAPHQKRHVSLSTMRGKYHAEKRRMAEQHSAKKDNEESGWEDEEEDLGEEDGDENWSDEDDSPKGDATDNAEPSNQLKTAVSGGEISSEKDQGKEKEKEKERRSSTTKPGLNRRRSSSRPRMARTTSDDRPGTDLLTLLTRKPSHQNPHDHNKDAPPPPAPTPLNKMSKKERQKATAERAKIEAQLEAQRQRKMFAKQQIFGNQGGGNQGLLASALQRGASMVNLQSALDGPSIRPSPTHGQLPSLASSPAPGPSLLRSKSAVAMPVQTGVSVTVPPHALNAVKEKKAQKNSQEKAKASVEMESSSEEETDADAEYLNTTQTKQKLAALAAKRDAKTQVKAKEPSPVSNQALPAVDQQKQPQSTQALPACPRVNEFGYVQPMTPTTRRRNIIMAEMSESLRRNVVLEREKSSGGGIRALGMIRPPPSTHTSKLPTHHSAINLTQYSRGGGGGEGMERTSSHPARASPNTSQPSSHTGAITTLPPPAPPSAMPPPSLETTRRRTTPNILGGGNFLKPLTRATIAQPQSQLSHHLHTQNHVQPQLQPQPQNQVCSQPNQYSVNQNPNSNNTNITENERSDSPSNLEAPAMMRRSTEGDGLHKERERRRELARRRDTTDTSYRLHGW